jgi:hypothetical protein
LSEPLQLHQELAVPLEQMLFLGMPLLLVLVRFTWIGHVAGSLEGLALPLTRVAEVNGVIGCAPRDRLAVTDRLHGVPRFELRVVSTAFSHRWEAH